MACPAQFAPEDIVKPPNGPQELMVVGGGAGSGGTMKHPPVRVVIIPASKAPARAAVFIAAFSPAPYYGGRAGRSATHTPLPRGNPDSAHGLRRRRLDLAHHAHVAGLPERVLVLADILFGQRIDMWVGAVLGAVQDLAADLQIPIRILGILDRERDG